MKRNQRFKYIILLSQVCLHTIWFLPILRVNDKMIKIHSMIGYFLRRNRYILFQKYIKGLYFFVILIVLIWCVMFGISLLSKGKVVFVTSFVGSWLYVLFSGLAIKFLYLKKDLIEYYITSEKYYINTEDIHIIYKYLVFWMGWNLFIILVSCIGYILDREKDAVIMDVSTIMKPKHMKYQEMDFIQTNCEQDFTGVLLCDIKEFRDKAYPLKDKTEVFIYDENKRLLVKNYETVGKLVGIYYIKEYEEYCIEPFEKMYVFLESGQPLGKNRQYYFSRGTKIYIKNRTNMYTLA